MPIRLDTADSLTGTPINFSTGTVMFWVRRRTDPNTWQVMWSTWNSGSTLLYIGTSGNGTSLEVWYDGSAYDTGGTISASTWTHIALTRTSGNVYTCYMNGVQEFTRTINNFSGALNNEALNDDAFDENGDWDFAFFKEWTVALTQDEIINEMAVGRPVMQDGLYRFTPFFPGSGERVRDYSGNGNDWTEVGSPTDGVAIGLSFGGDVIYSGSVISTGVDITIGAGTWAGLSGQALSVNDQVRVAVGTWASLIGQTVNAAEQLIIGSGSWQGLSGQAISLNDNINVAAGTWQALVGQAISVLSADNITIASGTWAGLAGQPITLLLDVVETIGAGTWAGLAGQAITILEGNAVTIPAGTWASLIGQAITVSSSSSNIENLWRYLDETVQKKTVFEEWDIDRDVPNNP